MHRIRMLVFSAATFLYCMGLSIERVDGGHRSTAMGIHQSVYAVGMFAGPWIGGALADAMGIRSMFLVVAVFCLVASNVLVLFHPRPPLANHPGVRYIGSR